MMVEQLKEEYIQKRAETEQRYERGEIKELPPEKETLRKVVGEKITPPEEKPVFEAPKIAPGIPSYQIPEIRDQVQIYVNTAFEKSVDEAVKQIRETHNPHLIDAFHDALVDELYNQLVEAGKIKELKLAA